MGSVAVSGFSPEWLALREPADLVARNVAVRDAMKAHFANRQTVRVCDLGAGTGASLRATADHLPPTQSWLLVDHDARNLEAAGTALATWADEATPRQNGVTLRRSDKLIEVGFRVHDFARSMVCWTPEVELITASALFDLASTAWIQDFVGAARADKVALMSMLTANDDIRATPPHALDGKIVAAFHRHQTSDKGFGPSAGAAAARVMEEALSHADFHLTAGDSPWLLPASPLLDATTQGMARAALETGDVTADEAAEWLRHQHAHVQTLRIGHRDVFAYVS